MTQIKLYLNDNSTVVAYALSTDPPESAMYLGIVEIGLEDLNDLMDWMQMTADATVVQITQKFTANYKKQNPPSDLN
jgi:ABC-type proline/glycine betaine transport system substrate-binding protein